MLITNTRIAKDLGIDNSNVGSRSNRILKIAIKELNEEVQKVYDNWLKEHSYLKRIKK